MNKQRYVPSYDEYIKEQDAEENSLLKLAEKMANECSSLWLSGDGHGGHVLEVIKNAFERKGFRPLVSSQAWRARYIPASTRTEVFERDAYRCVKCNGFRKLCVDHIYPHSKGGGNNMDNLQTLCWDCNSKKSNKVEL
ncbi:MAG: HNH endonuclease [Devosia sp.]